MSEENVAIVRGMYDAYNHADAGAALAYFDAEVVMDASHRVDGRVGHGREELVAILTEWLGTWDDFREEIEDVRDLGRRVLVISTQRGRGKGSAIEWTKRFAMLYEIRSGKITRWTVYDDLHQALAAAGLRE